MDASSIMGMDIPDGWTWERFTVVDAGNGEIALHSTIHNRFVRMNLDPFEPESKLFQGGYIGDYTGDYCRDY